MPFRNCVSVKKDYNDTDKWAFERRRFMSDFSINEMLDMQKRLQNNYKDKWEKICPEEIGRASCRERV